MKVYQYVNSEAGGGVCEYNGHGGVLDVQGMVRFVVSVDRCTSVWMLV